MNKSMALASLSIASRGAENHALLRRSCSALLSVIAVLQRRFADNTLLPNAVRKEEVDYYACHLTAIFIAQNKPVPSPPGFCNRIQCAYRCAVQKLDFFAQIDCAVLAGGAAEVGGVVCACSPFLHLAIDAFPDGAILFQVFQALDFIPLTAGLHERRFEGENAVLALMEEHMNPRNYEPAFCAAVLRKWRSDAVSSVLQARGVLQTGVADAQKTLAEFYARQREDIAKHGLRDCALPSSAKTETTVKEFAHCSGCYCAVY